MKVYIDALLLLNFFFDFLLLLTTSIVLKRHVKIFNILLGAFIGSLSTVILFFNINAIELLIIKIYLSIIMNLVAFYCKSFKYVITNIGVFYTLSFLLAGFLYYLNIEFTNINIIFPFIISPIILCLYIKQNKIFTRKTKNIYEVNLIVGKTTTRLTGYLDTGNNLSFKNKPVIFTNLINNYHQKKTYIPYMTINGSGVIECIEAKLEVNNIIYKVFLGFSENVKINNADLLLNNKLEGIT